MAFLAITTSITCLIFLYSSENIVPQIPLSALPPWAEELNRDIDGQLIGRIIEIEKSAKRNSISLYVKISQHLNHQNYPDTGKGTKIKLRIYDKKQKERIESLITKPTSNDTEYIISFKVIREKGAESFELITIDPYID